MVANDEIKKLTDLTSLITKGSTPTTYGHQFVDESKGEATFIGAYNCSFDGAAKLDKKKWITSEANEMLKRSKLVNEDSILCIVGNTIGSSFMVEPSILPANINQNVSIIRPIKDKVFPLYLKYAIRSPFVQWQVIQEASTQAQPSLSLKQVGDFKIFSPPLPEQQKIAKILSTWDKAISTTEALIDNSKQQKKSLMQQLLTGKKRFSGFESEWNFSTFSELYKVANNKKTQVKSADYLTSGNIPIVDQGKPLIGGYTDNYEVYRDLPVIVFGDHTRVVKWVDFVFAQGADGTQILKNTSTLGPKFAYYLLLNTDIPNLGYSRHMRELKEKNFKFPVDIQEQQKIASILTNADKEIELLEQQLADLKQEKKSLMQQLLTGKRRVKVDEVEAA